MVYLAILKDIQEKFKIIFIMNKHVLTLHIHFVHCKQITININIYELI
jgi:hypothetical protein